MAFNIVEIVSSVIKPLTDLADEMHTSDEERLTLKAKAFEVQAQLTVKIMDYEARLLEAQAGVIKAEAGGQSWIQRSWRPITMLTFLALVVADTFGLTEFRLADQAWTLLQIGLGGYVVGRSAEKIAPHIKDMVAK